MHLASNIVELSEYRKSLANDEDFIALLENDGGDCIFYVRNYRAGQEFIIVSESVLRQLPESSRPLTYVFLKPHYFVLKQFKKDIRKHVMTSGQLGHFKYLFDCSLAEFFETL